MRDRVISGGIEITNYCNLECIHCYVGDCDKPSFMKLCEIQYLIEQLKRYQAQYIVISGGEPFLHPNITELIHIIGTKFSSMRFIIATNGTLLTKEALELLWLYENIELQISLDGATKETHELQHGGGDFDRILDVFEQISLLPRKRKIMRMTISRINYNECVQIAELAKKYNTKVQYVYVCNVGRAKKYWNELEMSIAQQIFANESILRYARSHPTEEITAPRSVLSCPFENPDALFGVDIHTNGDVNICTCLDSEYIVGNALREEFSVFLNSPRIEKLSRKINLRKNQLLQTECKNCSALNRCSQGCIGRAKLIGNEFGLDGECEFRKALQFKNFFFLRENQWRKHD